MGDWIFHCHVNDHNMAGMKEFYSVLAANDSKCAINTFTQPDGLNSARQSFINDVCVVNIVC